MEEKMTPEQQVAVALYDGPYGWAEDCPAAHWVFEKDYERGNAFHDWNGKSHQWLLEKAEALLQVVEGNLELALAIIKAI